MQGLGIAVAIFMSSLEVLIHNGPRVAEGSVATIYFSIFLVNAGCTFIQYCTYATYLQPSAFRRPSSLLQVRRLQKAFVSKMSLCKSRACITAMLV